MRSLDPHPRRWRFLGSTLPDWLLFGAVSCVLVWLCAAAWLLLDVIFSLLGWSLGAWW